MAKIEFHLTIQPAEEFPMKNLIWLVGGACAAVVGVLVWGNKSRPAVPELAHRLEDAWADHHTVA
jgi:hypothetical protein